MLGRAKSIALPRSQYEGNLLPLSSPSSVTRRRSITLKLLQSHGSERLPLYYANVSEVEKLDYHPNPRILLSLSPKIVYLIFAALGYQNQTMLTSQDHPYILGAAMVITFAASFSAMLIKHYYPRLAAFVEKIGYLSFALSFLVMTKVFFSGNLILWFIIGGLALAFIMPSLFISFFI